MTSSRLPMLTTPRGRHDGHEISDGLPHPAHAPVQGKTEVLEERHHVRELHRKLENPAPQSTPGRREKQLTPGPAEAEPHHH